VKKDVWCGKTGLV